MRYNKHRVQHIMSSRVRDGQPSNFVFFDNETFDQLKGSNPRLQQQILWFGWCYAFRYEQGKITREKRFRYTKTKDFWAFIESRLDQCRTLYVLAHNLKVDFTWNNGWLEPEERNWESTYNILEDPPMMLTYKVKGCKVVFLDTFNYWKCSVDDMGQSIGLQKLKMPKKDASKEDWDNYCFRDVEILAKQVTSLLDFLEEKDLGAFGISAPTISLNIFRKRFMNHEIFLHDRNAVLKLERDCYYGGLVNNFYVGKVYNQRTYWIDVNSLYPYVMLKSYPVKLLDERKDVSPEYFKTLSRLDNLCATVIIEDQTNVYPKKHNGRLCDVQGKYITSLCGVELERAIKQRSIKWVKHCSTYEMQPIFYSFINYMWKLRSEYKAGGERVKEQLVKLFMNSLYGKFGMKGHTWRNFSIAALEEYYSLENAKVPSVYYRVGFKPTITVNSCNWHAMGLRRPIKLRYNAGALEMQFPTGEHSQSFCAIAAFVTSYARDYLRSLIRIAGQDNVYYCDTDSLFLNETGYQTLSKKGYISSTELGKLKLEGTAMNCVFNGPKDYVFDAIVKRKGIRKNAAINCQGDFVQDQWEGINSVLKRGGKPYIEIKRIVKHLNRKYTKGTVLTSGKVMPFMLNES